jgi:hypothetical protein
MKLNNLGVNQVEITKSDGTVVFFSYNTPVAAFVPGVGYIRTEKHWSSTTSKHINKWLDGRPAPTFPQSYFDSLQ